MSEVGEIRDRLGEDGLRGVALLVAGLLVIGRENRTAAVGVAVVVAGVGLVARGLVQSALGELGMGDML